MSEGDYPYVVDLLSGLTWGDEPVPFNAYEVRILLRGGCTADDFEHAVDAWIAQPACNRSPSGTPWGYIRAVALRRRGEFDEALDVARAKEKVS